MHGYAELFGSIHMLVEGEQGPVSHSCFAVISEEPGDVALRYALPRGGHEFTGEIRLPVPLVQPIRFLWDQGIFGHLVQMPVGALGRLGTRRFCHPLLVSPTADRIAFARDRAEFSTTAQFGFTWQSVFHRLLQGYQAAVVSLLEGRRRIEPPLVWSRLHRATREVVGRLPVSSDAQLLRQMFEVELGYPEVLGDDWLHEQIKLRFIEKADAFADVLCTGKNSVGRYVTRVRTDAPRSHVTGQPMPDLSLAISPLGAWGIPIRYLREGRAVADCLDFENTVPPPLRVAGAKLPAVLARKLTTVNLLIADIPGQNVFVADETTAQEFGVDPGDEICLDAILVTPSGQERLQVRDTESDTLDAAEFLARKEELGELPGFEVEEIPDLVETMLDGTPVFAFQYRYRYTVPIPCGFDKLKLLAGGIKGVTRPIPQLHAWVGGELQEVDIVVAERALLAKAALRDTAVYPLAVHAGLTEIDPAWTFDELLDRIEAGLRVRGLPADGRFEIVRRKKVPVSGNSRVDEETCQVLKAMGTGSHHQMQEEVIGKGIFGPIPVVRTQETEHRQSSVSRGVCMNLQTRLLGNIPLRSNEAVARQVEQHARFAYTANAAVEAALPNG